MHTSWANHAITITLSETKKQKPLSDQLEFGRVFTDHMFIADYTEGQGWGGHRIVPYAPIDWILRLPFFTTVNQFLKDMKAYIGKDGKVLLFRPEENMRRMNKSVIAYACRQFNEESRNRSIRKTNY